MWRVRLFFIRRKRERVREIVSKNENSSHYCVYILKKIISIRKQMKLKACISD